MVIVSNDTSPTEVAAAAANSPVAAPRVFRPLPEPPIRAPERPLAVSRNLDFVDMRILSQLKNFNLCDSVLSQEPFIVGRGSFSDVFKGFCRIQDRGTVMAAMKRLRLHVNAMECKRVSYARAFVIAIPDQYASSCLRRRFTCGQNLITRTCCLFWAMHLMRIRDILCLSRSG